MCQSIEDMRKQEHEDGFQEGVKQGIKQGIEQGEKNGMRKNAEEVALRMLKAGKYALDEIMNLSGLTMPEVQGLQAAATA